MTEPRSRLKLVAWSATVGFVAGAFAQVPFTRIHAWGRPDLSAKIHAAEVLPFVVAAVWLTTSLGAVGAAIAWTARNFADWVLLEWGARGAVR